MRISMSAKIDAGHQFVDQGLCEGRATTAAQAAWAESSEQTPLDSRHVALDLAGGGVRLNLIMAI
jgi:hypothetical protein